MSNIDNLDEHHSLSDDDNSSDSGGEAGGGSSYLALAAAGKKDAHSNLSLTTITLPSASDGTITKHKRTRDVAETI